MKRREFLKLLPFAPVAVKKAGGTMQNSLDMIIYGHGRGADIPMAGEAIMGRTGEAKMQIPSAGSSLPRNN